jgi:hypothetical protein
MNRLNTEKPDKKMIIREIRGSCPVAEYFNGKSILGLEIIMGGREVSKEALKKFVNTPINQLRAESDKCNGEKEVPKFEFHGADESGNFGYSYQAATYLDSIDIRLFVGSTKFSGGEDIPQMIIVRNLVLRIEADEREAAIFKMAQDEVLDLYNIYEHANRLMKNKDVRIWLLGNRNCYLVNPSVGNLIENAKRKDGGFAPNKKIERFGIILLNSLGQQFGTWLPTEKLLDDNISKKELDAIPHREMQYSVKENLPRFADLLKRRIRHKIEGMTRMVRNAESERVRLAADSHKKIEMSGLVENFQSFVGSLPSRIEGSLKGWEALYKN